MRTVVQVGASRVHRRTRMLVAFGAGRARGALRETRSRWARAPVVHVIFTSVCTFLLLVIATPRL